MDVQFNQLESLHWLWLILVLAGVVFVSFKLRRRNLLRFADALLLDRLIPTLSAGKSVFRRGLVLASMVVLVAGIAR